MSDGPAADHDPAPRPDVVVLRGEPDAVELAALMVALAARPAHDPVDGAGPAARPGPVAGEAPRGLGTVDRFWMPRESPW